MAELGISSGGLPSLSAAELAVMVKAGEVSAREVTMAHIERIEEVDGRLNAVVVKLYDEALAAADEADAKRRRGEELGPLHGVPVTIKECHDVAGTCTSLGLPSRIHHRAREDAPSVARLRKAGAIILGKTNVPQLLLYYETDNPVYGCTNNPWDLGRSPGGSSGGEGAILAAGGSALGLGSDVGGSIRIPAHFCGIHGLKPTSRRLSGKGSGGQVLIPGMEAILDQKGPMARHVADLRTAMEVLAAPGQHKWDPSIPPVPWPGRNMTDNSPGAAGGSGGTRGVSRNSSPAVTMASLDEAAARIKGMKIGFYEDDGFFRPSPAIRRAVRDAAVALESAGAEVESFDPPNPGQGVALHMALLSGDGARWSRPLLRGGKKDPRIGAMAALAGIPRPVRRGAAWLMEKFGQELLPVSLRAVGRRSVAAYWKLVAARDELLAEYLGGMKSRRLQALVCPPFMVPAFTHGASRLMTGLGSYAGVYNLLGMPSGVVSISRVGPGEETEPRPRRDIIHKAAARVEEGSAGMPIGVQVVAPLWREDRVLDVMEFLELHFRGTENYPDLLGYSAQ